jgi:hypothetical protein
MPLAIKWTWIYVNSTAQEMVTMASNLSVSTRTCASSLTQRPVQCVRADGTDYANNSPIVIESVDAVKPPECQHYLVSRHNTGKYWLLALEFVKFSVGCE